MMTQQIMIKHKGKPSSNGAVILILGMVLIGGALIAVNEYKERKKQ